MKKIIILFSIFLITNISLTTSDPLEDLLGGLLGGILGGVLGTLKNLLRNLLGSTLLLSEEDLSDLAEKLKELSKLGYKISSEELLKRAKEIAEINRLAGGEWTAHFNLESLLPLEVQKRLCGSFTTKANKGNDDEDGADEDGPPREKRQARRSKRAASCTYNIEFDARDRWPGCKPFINYVQTQGHCGSCWAHSAASCYTDRYCIDQAKKGASIPFNASYIFSAYEILSCSRENGCKGGSEEEAYGWIKKNGICTGTDYQRQDGCKPYPFNLATKSPQPTGCSQTCTKTGWTPTYPTDRKHYVKDVGILEGEDNIKIELSRYGSVSASFNAYEDFHYYKDGVYSHVWGYKPIGHSVVIVGYGTATCDGKKIPFWIIRNSYSITWGMGGFFYMRRGYNECDVEKYISYPIF